MKRYYTGALVACLVFLLSACGGGELDQYGCRSDSDCKHGRICINGYCQDSSGRCRSDGECPSDQHCYNGQCLVCDGDSDGVFGANCSGADCDDTNGAIHPGAAELCGDNLDNDCDGATDPESLCENCADIDCPPGYACDPQTGECVLICTPNCGDRQCGPDGCGGTCGTCPEGFYCDRTGTCVEGCQDRCNAGAKACAGSGVTYCEDTDGDGCVEWSAPIACPEDTRCVNGECEGCEPNCAGKQCGGDGCGGSCGDCGPNQHCENGRCVSGCQDECRRGESECLDQYSFRTCGEFDGDPCTEWGQRERCPEGSTCDQSTGTCGGTCYDECYWGERKCWDEMSYVDCGQYDNDPCLEVSPPIFCPPDQMCDFQTGYCTGECWDECWWGEFYCRTEREYIVCGQYDSDPCAEFSPPQRCPRETRCSEEQGACVGGTCQDECYPGQTQCLDEWMFVDCGQYDNDPCMEWGWNYPIPCPPDSRCDWMTGYCTSVSCQDDAFEPDDYYMQATPLSPNMSQTHSICPASDQDWWVFRLAAVSDVTLETSGYYGDTVMYLYDANLRLIAENDDTVDLWSRIVERGLPVGAYYVEVVAYGGYQPIETYYLMLTTSGSCTPNCANRQCGPDGCGGICGTCPAGEFCDTNGQCVTDGHRRGAGDPCGMYQGCPVDWSAAWTCIEYPGQLDGFCSYPCSDADDCSYDFPNGCCRELVAGYSVCLPQNLCTVDHPGYREDCTGVCMPDMFCLDMSGTGDQMCIFTCDTAMGVCPAGGTCIDPGDGSSTGFCLPSGDGQFGDPCTMASGCQTGLLCTQLDEQHPGYCNRLCSSIMPCPYPFSCLLEDGQGGRWCAATCSRDSDCSMLGDWVCLLQGGWGVCVPSGAP